MNGDLVRIGGHKKKTQDETWRLVATLAVAGFLSGLAIVGAYELTKPRIERNQAEALRRAVFEVVPGAQTLQRLIWQDGKLEPAAADGASDGTDDAPAIYGAYGDGGQFLGYAIPGTGAGYQDAITLLYGVDPEGRRVIGMQVLESRETPGLGDRIYKDQSFVDQFRDLAVEPQVEVVTDGATAPNEVDGLTGATISSKAVVAIINTANATWRERLPPPDEAPPLQASPPQTPPQPGAPE